MRNIFTYLFCILVFSSSKCKKDKECHPDVSLTNNSSQDVIYALKMYDPNKKCVLSGSRIQPGEIYRRSTSRCWEDKLVNGANFDLYIVDPNKYNSINVFYNCDSIEIKNKILKHFVLTLDDLKKTNFEIAYP